MEFVVIAFDLSLPGVPWWEAVFFPISVRLGAAATSLIDSIANIHFQRTSPYPQLMNFDAPRAELSGTRRERTDTPLQALNLMNDAVFFESAQGLALRVMREGGETFGDRLDYVYLVTLGREPGTLSAPAWSSIFRRPETAWRRTRQQ